MITRGSCRVGRPADLSPGSSAASLTELLTAEEILLRPGSATKSGCKTVDRVVDKIAACACTAGHPLGMEPTATAGAMPGTPPCRTATGPTPRTLRTIGPRLGGGMRYR
jgi:hypothetical protein